MMHTSHSFTHSPTYTIHLLTQGLGNPWKTNLEIREILGAPMPDHYFQVPKNESDAWKENEYTFKDLLKRLRDKDKHLIHVMRRARRPMLFSVVPKTKSSVTESQNFHVNAGSNAVTEVAGIDAKSSLGKRVSSIFIPIESGNNVNIDETIKQCWSHKKDAHMFVQKGKNKVFGMSMVVLYDCEEKPIGFVFVLKPMPHGFNSTNAAEAGSAFQVRRLSKVRETFMRKIVSDATKSARTKYNEAMNREHLRRVLLRYKIKLGSRKAEIEMVGSDESGLSEDELGSSTTSNSSSSSKSEKEKQEKKKKKKKKKKKRTRSEFSMINSASAITDIEALTKPIKFRRAGVYMTNAGSPGSPKKVIMSSKGVFDIHNQTKPQDIYGKGVPNVNEAKSSNSHIRVKELPITGPDGTLEKVVHLVRVVLHLRLTLLSYSVTLIQTYLTFNKHTHTQVRQEIEYEPRISKKELNILDGMLELARGSREVQSHVVAPHPPAVPTTTTTSTTAQISSVLRGHVLSATDAERLIVGATTSSTTANAPTPTTTPSNTFLSTIRTTATNATTAATTTSASSENERT
jgi:hypothetical protein